MSKHVLLGGFLFALLYAPVGFPIWSVFLFFIVLYKVLVLSNMSTVFYFKQISALQNKIISAP